MHQNDPDNVGNFPVHSARVVVAFWAQFLQLSSVQIQLGINAHIRNHQSTTGLCVWLLILCCMWICTKRTAGITADLDLDDCVDLLALGVVWLCLGVQLICGVGVAWLLEGPVHTTSCSLVLDFVASVDCGVLVACFFTKAW